MARVADVRLNQMLRTFISAIVISGLSVALASSAEAGTKRHGYRNGPQVKGFVQRRGGYSYSSLD